MGSLLVCAYPVTEAFYSMVRRMLRLQQAGQPDSEYLHSLIKKTFGQALLQFIARLGKECDGLADSLAFECGVGGVGGDLSW